MKNLTKINLKDKKGMTLLALVITIVVLLILGAIVIREITGDGIFSKTKEAREANSKAKADEKVELAMQEWMIENVNEDKNDGYFKTFLEGKFNIDDEDNNVTGDESPYTVLVEEGDYQWKYELSIDGTIKDKNYVDKKILTDSMLRYEVIDGKATVIGFSADYYNKPDKNATLYEAEGYDSAESYISDNGYISITEEDLNKSYFECQGYESAEAYVCKCQVKNVKFFQDKNTEIFQFSFVSI